MNSLRSQKFGTGDLLETIILPSILNPGAAYAVELDITAVLNQAVTTSMDWFGIRLHNAQYNPGTPIDINSNAAQVALGDVTGLFPQYIETAPAVVPLPAAFPLFATALAGMGLMGWRRRRRTDPLFSTPYRLLS